MVAERSLKIGKGQPRAPESIDWAIETFDKMML
jgi:hypothetical protein